MPPTPKLPQDRVNRAAKIRGEWHAVPGSGWQHGDIPKPPPRLLASSREAWTTWMQSWVAAHWTVDDLPGLRVVIALYDQVQRGEVRGVAAELRQMMDEYGITPKGKQDRRWLPPKETEVPTTQAQDDAAGPYATLRVVGE